MPNDHMTTLRQARAALFEANGFDERSYEADWLDIDVGPIPVRLPMTDDARRALPLHDLHHVVTGYDTDVVGEFELAAWEIGSGCTMHPDVFASNLSVMGAGLVAHPVRTFRAFARGRREKNLYREGIAVHGLDEPVIDARTRLHIGRSEKTTPGDAMALVGWSPLVALSMAAYAAALPLFAVVRGATRADGAPDRG